MSVAKMQKVIIASYQTEAGRLLEAVQAEGILQILDAERAIISKEWPELHTEAEKPRDIEGKLNKLEDALSFLGIYSKKEGLAEALAPRIVVSEKQYADTIKSDKGLAKLENAIELKNKIHDLNEKRNWLSYQIEFLTPWIGLEMPLEEIGLLEKGTAILGLLPEKNFDQAVEEVSRFGAVIEKVGYSGNMAACVIACLKENAVEVQKTIRSLEFETANFGELKGIPSELIERFKAELVETNSEILEAEKLARQLAGDKLDLQILADYYRNLLGREKTRMSVPETEMTSLLEGWVKQRHLARLKEIVSQFKSSSITEIEPAEDEEIPVEIDNGKAVKPFETITRLHGMPTVGDVDPTVFLAPFFAIFFGLCLTDAGYGIIMAGAFWWLTKKFQGDKKAFHMFLVCSVCTIIAGALTGGWFGDMFQTLLPEVKPLNSFREKVMLFDPMKQPMIFFAISISLGYIQIMFGLFIGLFNNIRRKDYATAVFNFLVWIIFLNSLGLLIVSKVVEMPAIVGKLAGWVSILQAVLIFLFSERKSGMAGRVGGGVFALFSTVFYFGDILSYVRLMALGMVTAGLGIAVNILVQLVMDIPYVGFILGALLFAGGHMLNLALSVLSSFVHSLRLQFVEFFPKFFTGGGKEFKPLSVSYKYMMIKAE